MAYQNRIQNTDFEQKRCLIQWNSSSNTVDRNIIPTRKSKI